MRHFLFPALCVALLAGCSDPPSSRAPGPPVHLTHQSFPGLPVNRVLPLDAEHVAIGTRAGLMLWGKSGSTLHTGPTYDPGQDPSRPIAGKSPLPSSEISALVRTPDGTVWVGTSKGLCSLLGTHLTDETRHLPPTWTGKTAASGLEGVHEDTGHDITCLKVARDGRLLIGTRNAGLIVRSIDGQRYDVVHHHPDANQWVTGIVELPDGLIVASVFKLGLLRYDGKTVARFTAPDGWVQSDEIRSLAATTDGTVWAGTHHGLGMLRRDGTAKHFTARDVLPDDTICNLTCDPMGRLWCFTNRSTAVLTRDGWRYPLIDGDAATWLQGLNVSPDGDVWFWTWTCVKRNPTLTWQDVRPDLQYLDSLKSRVAASYPATISREDFMTAKDDDGRVWLACMDRVFSYDGREWQDVHLSDHEGITIHALHADRAGRIWLGTGGDGLFQFHRGRILRFNDDHRHARSVIYSIAEHTDGTLWFGTQHGLYTCSGNDVKPIFDGYQVDPLFIEPPGRIWFGDINEGILTYDQGQVRNLSQTGILAGYRVSQFTLTADGAVQVDAYRSDGQQAQAKRFIVRGDVITEIPTSPSPP